MKYFEVEISPAEALAIVLNAIAQRIGRRPGAHLGSMKLLVDRVFWHRKHGEFQGGYFFRDPQKPMFEVSEDGEKVVLISEIQEGYEIHCRITLRD